jgi:serine/threonine protein kinase
MVTAGSELTPGTTVDHRYHIQGTLGRGGFGRTYLAADQRRFGELCVLKEFVPSSEADPIVAEKLRELFNREATILHQLNHPQIPKFFAVFEEKQRLFIAQEYIDGKTYWRLLQERQRQGQTLSQREILIWLRNLLRVLEYLHRQNIVHRDISPDNIMLPRGKNTPVLIDFGVGKQLLQSLSTEVLSGEADDLIQASVSVGKFGYAPYEQIQMGQCSPRSDLYALAVTAVVLLTGKPPNLLIDAKSLEWQWPRWVKLHPQLTHVLMTMLANKPQNRYASATQALEQLRSIDVSTLPERSAPSRRQPTTQTALRTHAASTCLLASSAVADPLASQQPTAHELKAISANSAAVSQGFAAVPLDRALADQLPRQHSSRSAHTQVRGAIIPMPGQPLMPQTAAETVLPPLSTLPQFSSLRSWAGSLWAAAWQLPQDRQGHSLARRLSVRQLVMLGMLALLPIGGGVIGLQSSQMASLCWIVDNCASDREVEQRYRQAVELADSANVLSSQAQNLTDLQQARQRLVDSIAQLHTFSGKVKLSAYSVLPKYQTLLQSLDDTLERETRAAQLLSRADAEAQKANAQASVAKTLQQHQETQLQWNRVMATLAAIPKNTLLERQVTARRQEYQARLETTRVKVTALTPPSPSSTRSGTPAPRTTSTQRSTSPSVRASASASTVATAPAPSAPAQPAGNARPAARAAARPKTTAPRPQARPTASRSTRLTPNRPVQPQLPATSPLEVDRRWIAGSFVTSATQTLDHVAIWIEGKHTGADGRFTATLMIQNRSGQGFSFVPLYAESRDGQGNTIRTQVLFTGTSDTTLEPGEQLTGQISLIGPVDAVASQRVMVVIQESTGGNRTFRVPL